MGLGHAIPHGCIQGGMQEFANLFHDEPPVVCIGLESPPSSDSNQKLSCRRKSTRLKPQGGVIHPSRQTTKSGCFGRSRDRRTGSDISGKTRVDGSGKCRSCTSEVSRTVDRTRSGKSRSFRACSGKKTGVVVPEIAEVTIPEFPELPIVPGPENVEAPEKTESFPRAEIGREFPTIDGRPS